VTLKDLVESSIEKLITEIHLTPPADVAPDAPSSVTEIQSGPADSVQVRTHTAVTFASAPVWLRKTDPGFEKALLEFFDVIGLADNALDQFNDLQALVNAVEQASNAMSTDSGALSEPILSFFPMLTDRAWSLLSLETQKKLSDLILYLQIYGGSLNSAADYGVNSTRKQILELKPLVDDAVARSQSSNTASLSGLNRLAGQLGRQLERASHQFDVFAPGSANFGIVVEHTQRWEPQTYQAGPLIATLPLAPSETREVAIKTHVKESKARRNKSVSRYSNRYESTSSSRNEESVTTKASANSNFTRSLEGEVSISELGKVGLADKISIGGGVDTGSTRSMLRESAQKAAQEYSKENELEVTFASDFFSESTTRSVVSNPNSEISVTYLYYELQRRFSVSEKLSRLQPYVFIGIDIPSPWQIDESFIIEHSWTLRKAVLDVRFVEVLDYLCETWAGDLVEQTFLETKVRDARELVVKLEAQLRALKSSTNKSQQRLTDAIGESDNDDGALWGGLEWLLGDLDGDEARRTGIEATEKTMQFLSNSLQDVTAKLTGAADLYSAALDSLAAGTARIANWKVRIAELRTHIQSNVFWYMRSVWLHTDPTEIFMTYHDVEVDYFDVSDLTVVDFNAAAIGLLNSEVIRSNFTPAATIRSIRSKTKVGLIADLSNPFFVGNYIGFPLHQHNSHTLRLASSTIAIEESQLAKLEIADGKEQLLELFGILPPSEVVVPSGQLFIECLPGTQPVLEQFKVGHRNEDLLKARSGRIAEELENLRRCLRLSDALLNAPAVANPSLDSFAPERRYAFDGSPTITLNTVQPAPAP
jgi:hypothetical protein